MQIVVSILLRVVLIKPMLMACATSRLCLNSGAIAPLRYPLKNILLILVSMLLQLKADSLMKGYWTNQALSPKTLNPVNTKHPKLKAAPNPKTLQTL